MKNFSSLCFPCDSSGTIHQHWINESCIMIYFLQQIFMLIQSSQMVFLYVDSCTKTVSQIQLSSLSLQEIWFHSFYFSQNKKRRKNTLIFLLILKQWQVQSNPSSPSLVRAPETSEFHFISCTINYTNKTIISIGS